MSEKKNDITSDTSKPPQPIEIFYSYSHKDEDLRNELEKHLSVLKRNGVIAGWHDRKIVPGAEWGGEIDKHLEMSNIILLLVSSDFIASDYCYENEMKRAMERHAQRTARVIPVILRKCDWRDAPFGKLQALPKNGKPIKTWNDIDDAFADVVAGLKRTIAEIAGGPLAGLSSAPGSPTTDPTLVSHAPYSGMEDTAEIERLQENLETPVQTQPANTQEKAKKSADDPAVQVPGITSRRTLIGVIITAVLAAVAAISAAGINKCANAPQPGHFSQTFIGRIINKNTEEKIRSAKVSLEGEGVPLVAYSDSEGVFSFPINDPNKEIRLRIEADQYENFDLRVTPAKNQGIQDVRLTPKTDKTADLWGSVHDSSNDSPIQEAKVTLDYVLGMQPVDTDSDGKFSLKEVPRKSGEMVRVRVVKEGYKPHTEDVVLGGTPPRFKLMRK